MSAAEQYYPTYTFSPKHRDVLLLEFEEAQKIANGQTKVYGQVSNILLAVATFAFTFFIDKDGEKESQILKFVNTNSIIIISILSLFGLFLLRYFVDLQRQITINARKVVTLRTLLGLDYGRIQLTLPNWRVEGATNPFVIKYFHGWLKFRATPFWVIFISINLLWYFITKDRSSISFLFFSFNINLPWILVNLLISAIYYWIFRRNLYDRHETFYLNFVQSASKIFRIKLIPNFEDILYRAKLSFIELERLGVDFTTLKQILIEVEDKSFYTSSSVSFKALGRGMLSRFKYFRNKYSYIENGGSTIIMQLCRTLFIISNQNKYLRKIIEIFLSFWLNRQFDKKTILKMYISSVRYDKGILGLASAVKYFFGDLPNRKLTAEESFFLVERLSNVTSTVNKERVTNLALRISTNVDMELLLKIYDENISNGKLKAVN